MSSLSGGTLEGSGLVLTVLLPSTVGVAQAVEEVGVVVLGGGGLGSGGGVNLSS